MGRWTGAGGASERLPARIGERGGRRPPGTGATAVPRDGGDAAGGVPPRWTGVRSKGRIGARERPAAPSVDLPEPTPERFAVRLAPSREKIGELALVLQAVGVPHEIVRLPHGWALAVPAPLAARAEEELARYERENENWPPRRARFRPLPGAALGAAAYAAVLCLCFVLSNLERTGPRWFEAGRSLAARVREGEWWRVVTALTLHTDLAHLAGNVVFGALFGALLAQVLGNGAAWFAILLAGALGNLANAWAARPTHSSVGASTAVFAALGLLAAVQWRRFGRRRGGTLLRLAPLFAAGALLGFLGAGGERTDVSAHLFGFLAGLLLGASHHLRDERPFGPRAQFLLGTLALALVAGCWALALR